MSWIVPLPGQGLEAQAQLCEFRAAVSLSPEWRTLWFIFLLKTQTQHSGDKTLSLALHAQSEAFVPRALLVAESLTMSIDRTVVTVDLHMTRTGPETSIM